MNPDDRQTIFTIGHGDASFPEIERLLHLHNVATIVDVRSDPYSRHAPDFRKSVLADLAAAAGIGYRWMGGRLGGHTRASRPPGPSDAEGGTVDAVDSALGEVLALNSSGPVVLLCSERDPEHCHRDLVLAPRLEATGLQVMHILPGGSAHRYQPNLGI